MRDSKKDTYHFTGFTIFLANVVKFRKDGLSFESGMTRDDGVFDEGPVRDGIVEALVVAMIKNPF